MPFVNEPFAQTLFLSFIYITAKMSVDALLLCSQPGFLTLAQLIILDQVLPSHAGALCTMRCSAGFLASTKDVNSFIMKKITLIN